MQFNDIVSSFLYQHDHHRPPQVWAIINRQCQVPRSDKDTRVESSLLLSAWHRAFHRATLISVMTVWVFGNQIT